MEYYLEDFPEGVIVPCYDSEKDEVIYVKFYPPKNDKEICSIEILDK